MEIKHLKGIKLMFILFIPDNSKNRRETKMINIHLQINTCTSVVKKIYFDFSILFYIKYKGQIF